MTASSASKPAGDAAKAARPPRSASKTRSCDRSVWRDLRELERFEVPAGHMIFREGEPSERMALVSSGTVRLFQMLSGGRRQIVSFAVRGDVLNLPGVRNDLSAEAVDAVSLYTLPRADVERLLAQDARFAGRLLGRATADLARLRRQLGWIGRQTAEERIWSFLSDLHRRSRNDRRGGHLLPLPMTRQDIADHLGLAIETVSRILGRLAAEGALTVVPNGVELLDSERLKIAAAPLQTGHAQGCRAWKRRA